MLARTMGGARNDPEPGTAPGSELLRLEAIDKAFAGVHALRGAGLSVSRPGVGHALVGANGSGKSTLLGVLSGQLRPDGGTVSLNGRALNLARPADAVGHGIVMVAQETAVAPDLSVAENMLLGRMIRRRMAIDWRATQRAAAEVMAQLDATIDVGERVGGLRPDQQQIVEIARALTMRCQVMILDEPTSSLSEDEVASVSAAIQRVKGLGVAVVLVSHRFEEIFALCEEVTVLRDGCTVGDGALVDHDAEGLIALMVGRERTLAAPAAVRARPPGKLGHAALRLSELTRPGVFADVSLAVGAGEIVGLAGLVGCGRSELLAGVFGEGGPVAGTVQIGESQVQPGPRELIAHGAGYVPPDRKHQGLVLSQSVAENLAMVRTLGRARYRMTSAAADIRLAREMGERLALRAASPTLPVGSLSGGNQQKVSLGKWLAADVRVLLLDEPTRGVDVEAKAEIHQLLREYADRGVAMLVSSSESSELLALCSRILVMVRGRITADLPAGDLSVDTLATHTGGQL